MKHVDLVACCISLIGFVGAKSCRLRLNLETKLRLLLSIERTVDFDIALVHLVIKFPRKYSLFGEPVLEAYDRRFLIFVDGRLGPVIFGEGLAGKAVRPGSAHGQLRE